MKLTGPIKKLIAPFPEPVRCPLCGHASAFRIGKEHLACTSQECDPEGGIFAALYRVYAAAGPPPGDERPPAINSKSPGG